MTAEPLHNERGVALLITLLVITLCIALVVEMNYDVRVKLNYAGNYKDQMSAFFIAKSGVNAAKGLLENDAKSGGVDYLGEYWAQTSTLPLPIGDGILSLVIEDEGKKININNVVRSSGSVNQRYYEAVKNLFNVLEVEEGILDEIVDWLDTDDDTSMHGAEYSYYRSLTKPYVCKNYFLDSMDELKLVRSINAETYEKISPYLTIYTDKAMVNINTAEAEVLMALSADITKELAEDIVAARQDQYFEHKPDIKKVQGFTPELYNAIAPMIDVQSDAFMVTSTGEVNDSRKVIKAIITRSGTGNCRIAYWNSF